MKTQTSITLVAALAALFALSACNEEEQATTETPSAENAPAAEEATAEAPAEQPAAEQPAAEQPAQADQGGAAGDACTRAAQCCEDYVAAMGGGAAMAAVQSSCANYRTMANTPAASTCQTSIDGWRQALTTAQHEVPASCQ